MLQLHRVIDLLFYYKVTIVMVGLLCYCIWLYKKGKKMNLEIVEKCMAQFEPVIRKYYTDYDGKIIQESPNVLKAYASGRKSSHFVILGFAMVARQQILAHLFNDLIFKIKDEIVIEIPIKSVNYPIFAMAVLRRTQVKNITKRKYPDLKTLCKQYKTNLPENLIVIAQSKEYLHQILNDKIVTLWTTHSHLIKMFYMSDINKFSQYPYSVRFVVEIKQKQLDAIAELLEGLFVLVDRLSLIKMSDKCKEQALRKRQDILDIYNLEQSKK